MLDPPRYGGGGESGKDGGNSGGGGGGRSAVQLGRDILTAGGGGGGGCASIHRILPLLQSSADSNKFRTAVLSNPIIVDGVVVRSIM